MFKRPKEKSVRPEGQNFSKYIIFEVLTLCGSNRFKKFLMVPEKFNFQNMGIHQIWRNSGSKMLKSGAFP